MVFEKNLAFFFSKHILMKGIKGGSRIINLNNYKLFGSIFFDTLYSFQNYTFECLRNI